MQSEQLAAIRAGLAKQKSDIERQLEHYQSAVGASGVKPDQEGFADSAHVAAERSEAISMMDQLEQSRADVERALARIDQGTYGKCERCASEISPERLEILPTASLCVSCKQLAGR